MDFDEIKSQLINEINCALKIWTDLLINFHGNNLSYVYSKGSAVKNWEGPIDYVPVISDIDIHYGVHDKSKLFNIEDPRESSLKVTLDYENKFSELNLNKIHIPRTQVMCISNLSEVVQFVAPRADSVKMLFGDFPDYPKFEDEKIRRIDLENLQELKPYLDKLPDAWFDKVGMDYWSSLRLLNWKVSPTPVRIITQMLQVPLDIWTWNRTRIKLELEALNLTDIAKMYEKYYMNSWQLFESNLSNSIDFQNCLLTGSKVLELCYNWYIQYTTNDRK